jgi:hypothetical protein
MINKDTISAQALHIELKEMFEFGATTYAKCSEAIRSKYKMGAERFSKQYKEAHQEWSDSKKATQDKVISTTTENGLISGILSKQEGLQILSEIARGEKKVVDGNIIVPSPTDRRGAVIDLAKIEGWMAPTKTDVTTNGDNINNVYVVEYTE